MSAEKLQHLNQILLVKLKKLQEEREQDVRDLQERIDYLEKREAKLMADLVSWEEAMKTVQGGEGVVSLVEENQRLKDAVDELEKLLATQEFHFQEREKALLASTHKRRSRQQEEMQEVMSPKVMSPEVMSQDGDTNKRKLARTRSRPHSLHLVGSSLPRPQVASLESIPQTPPTPHTALETTPPATPSPPPVPVPAVTEVELSWCPEQYIAANMARGDTAYNSSSGSGEIYFSCSRSPHVYMYQPSSKLWTRLQPPCPHLFFGMALVQGRVTAVGGQKGQAITPNLSTYLEVEEGGEGERVKKCWREPYPPMPTKRFNLTAVSIGKGSSEERLLAVGGLNQDGAPVDCVEVLSLESLQWSRLARLPRPADMLCSGVSHNQLYLLGASNTKRVYTCYIPYLLQTTPNQTLEVWFQLPDTPTTSPTGVLVGNQLLAVGGFDKAGVDSDQVSHFQQETRTWKLVSHMSRPCNKPLLAYLPGNQLMVVGGSTKLSHMMNVVQTANITLSQ